MAERLVACQIGRGLACGIWTRWLECAGFISRPGPVARPGRYEENSRLAGPCFNRSVERKCGFKIAAPCLGGFAKRPSGVGVAGKVDDALGLKISEVFRDGRFVELVGDEQRAWRLGRPTGQP